MVGLSDQIRGDGYNVGRKRRVQQILGLLDEEDRAGLISALDDQSVSSSSIQRALAKRGIGISLTAITTHRNGHHVTG